MSNWQEHARQRWDEIRVSHAAGGHHIAPNGHCVTCSRAYRKVASVMHEEQMQDPEVRAQKAEQLRPPRARVNTLQVADIMFSRWLHKLSGREDTYAYWHDRSTDPRLFATVRVVLGRDSHPGRWELVSDDDRTHGDYLPAFDLGYLLRKLPPGYCIVQQTKGMWKAEHLGADDLPYRGAGQPENCAAWLCIELFEQGVLQSPHGRQAGK